MGNENTESKTVIPFYTQTAILDAYLQVADPSADPLALEVICQTLREQEDLRNYFFSNGPHPAWAAVLWEASFFQTPPPPQQTENGLVRLRWPEQEYLISVAALVPDIILKHFAVLKDAPEYGERVIYALQLLPPELIVAALPQLLQWLRDPQTASITASATYELAVKLAERKQSAPAFELFRAVLTPQPSPKIQKIEKSFFGTEAIPLFKLADFDYSFDKNSSFRNALELFRSLDIRQTLAVLEDHLLCALRLEAQAKRFSEYERSSWWRTAIEESDQDIHGEYKDSLLIALRDSLRLWAQQDAPSAEALVRRYLETNHEILKRLGLYILSVVPDAYKNLVARELLNEKNLNDVGIHHEYFLLLQEGYPHLDEQKQQKFLALIRQGPPSEEIEQVSDDVDKDAGESRKIYIEGYIKHWKLKRLWMLRKYLSGEFTNLLEELVAELGEPERAEYTHWVSGGVYSVTDKSPIRREQLSLMPPEALIDFLRQWQPEPEQTFGPERITLSALGQAVAGLVFSDFDKYAQHLKPIALIGPAFATPLIRGFTSGTRIGSVRWADALEFCEAMLSDANIRYSSDNAGDENWRYTREAIVNLLEVAVEEPKADAGVEATDHRVQMEFLPRVRDLLLTLLDDPDPSPENDRPPENYVGHNDPVTVALNHVRPRALLTLIQYAVHRAQVEQGESRDDNASQLPVSRLEPKVREALTRKMNPQVEPSLAVHSVYGLNLRRLRWLDQNWLEEHLDTIFPEGGEAETVWLFAAAWDAFVAYDGNRFDRPFFAKLRPKYMRAINNLALGVVTGRHPESSNGLAAQLLWEYLNGNYQLRSAEGQDSLLVHFYMKAAPDKRGQAAWLLWRICQDNPQYLSDIWLRVRPFWEWRVDEAARSNHSNDFDSEMEWYARLPLIAFEMETIRSMWSLLEGILPHVARFKRRGIGWDSLEEYLAKEVERDPLRAIQFYHLMHKQLSPTVWFYPRSESRTIIEKAARQEVSRQEALALINTLARSGNHQYRDIYQQYAG